LGGGKTETRRERVVRERTPTPVQDFVSDIRETPLLSVAPWLIPHDEKADKGGEDTYFISEDGLALGVFDGVGGWSRSGVNPREYSYRLMTGCKDAAAEESESRDALNILTKGWLSARSVTGSSTACLAVIKPMPADVEVESKSSVPSLLLDIVNLGDSGAILVNNLTGQVLFHTHEQQHYFNCPYQLGSSSDRPSDGDRFHVEFPSGSTLILATDGVLDNISLNQISNLVVHHTASHSDTQSIAKAIATEAYSISLDPEAHTPFTTNAMAAGHRRGVLGGKPDDITVLVVRFAEDALLVGATPLPESKLRAKL